MLSSFGAISIWKKPPLFQIGYIFATRALFSEERPDSTYTIQRGRPLPPKSYHFWKLNSPIGSSRARGGLWVATVRPTLASACRSRFSSTLLNIPEEDQLWLGFETQQLHFHKGRQIGSPLTVRSTLVASASCSKTAPPLQSLLTPPTWTTFFDYGFCRKKTKHKINRVWICLEEDGRILLSSWAKLKVDPAPSHHPSHASSCLFIDSCLSHDCTCEV